MKGRNRMNRSIVRWILVALMALVLILTLSCPYLAYAEGETLPMDFLEGGKAPKEDGWTFDEKGNPLTYEDSTIQVSFEFIQFEHVLTGSKNQGKKVKDEAWVVRIKIRDVSQLRTAASKDTYTGKAQTNAEIIAGSKNAVVAMNGDFFKYEFDVGYVVRQGEMIRDATGNARGRIFDMLLIDSAGDFHVVYSATTEKIDAYVEENLTPQGRTVLDTFNIGPVLVLNGEVQDVSQTEMARQGCYEWPYDIERIAVVQTGELEYAIVTVGTKSGVSGMTMQEFAGFVAEQCPNAIMAYNLDGGGSANLTGTKQFTRGEKIWQEHVRLNNNNDLRPITDILYFASAED